MVKPHGQLVPVSFTPLLRFHTRPINLVVYEGPLGALRPRDTLSRGGLPAYMLSAVIPSAHSYPAMRLAPQPEH